MNSGKFATALILLLLVMLTAAAEDIPRQGCRRGTPRQPSALRRGQYAPFHCGGDFYKGVRHQLVVLASFADRPFQGDESATIAQWNKILNTRNLSEPPFCGSVHDYFYAQSYGQFDVIFDLQYVEVGSYVRYRSTRDDDENSQYLVDDALDLLLTRDIDWSLYDWNHDGFINQVVFVYAGRGSSYGGFGGDKNSIWPHQWRLNEHLDLSSADLYDHRDARQFQKDGVAYTVDAYCAVPEIGGGGGYDAFGILCHEYTHCFGFPDFYYDDSRKFVANWDLMDYGYSHSSGQGYCPVGFSAHERWLMGWLSPIELNQPTSVAGMPPLSDEPRAYLIRNDDHANEYYMVENRQRTHWDAKLPASGIIIFHIDFDDSLWATYDRSKVVNSPERQHYTIFAANNLSPYYYQSGWAYPYQGNNSLTDTSQPAALLWHARSCGSTLMSKPLSNLSVDSSGLASFSFMVDPSAIQASHVVLSRRDSLAAGHHRPAAVICDLQGRRLPDLPRQKGLYIVDGHKVVIK